MTAKVEFNPPEFMVEEYGIKRWYKNGLLHRDGAPAVIQDDGAQRWYQNGRLHRTDGPATIDINGFGEWWYEGQYHRDGGPAYSEDNGLEIWYRHGQYHRDDGPAYLDPDSNDVSWYIKGEYITSIAEYKQKSNISDERLLVMVLKYGGLE